MLACPSTISHCLARLLALALFAIPCLSQEPIQVAPKRQPQDEQVPIDFVRDIQPILAGRCFSCHSGKKRSSGLRLDERDAALIGGDHGPLLVPGSGGNSLLIQVLSGTHEEVEQMPVDAEALAEHEILLLSRWIDQGGHWPEGLDSATQTETTSSHWAFQPPARPSIPATNKTSWARTPIDHFVLARLEAAGQRPSAEADGDKLLRRLWLDLTGLPPGLDELDRFLSSPTEDGYHDQVDRLLDSPHYGERWGSFWLDAARYADSDGFEKDKPRFVWAYRDWVVSALNADMPYDQFIIRQIAGDLLPNATADDHVATGFLRNAMLNEEGGVDPEQFRTEGLIDRMDCIGKSILGLTVQCAQCHSHKFDPISQREYYQLFAFLNNDHEASRVAYNSMEQRQVSELGRQIHELEEGLRRDRPEWLQEMNQWEDSVRDDQPTWHVVEHRHTGENGERFYHYEDGSVRAASYAPTQWTAHFVGSTSLAKISAFRFEQIPDSNLPSGGPGRSIHGMSALSEFIVEAENESDPSRKVSVKFISATADFSNTQRPLEPEFQSLSRMAQGGDQRTYGPVEFAIDGNEDTAWGIDAGPGRRNVHRKAVFVPQTPLEFPDGCKLHFRLQQNHGGDNSDDNQNHNLGRWRISVSDSQNAVADPIPQHVRNIFDVPREERSPAQLAATFSYWRTTVKDFGVVNQQIEQLWNQWPQGTPSLTLAARNGDGPGESPRSTHIFERGDWLKPREEVRFGVPAILHSLPESADGSRLTFARWLVDRRSPTTARSIVNRIWQAYFGIGLVETPEDLGTQSSEPSHPELLDWLACELMDSGWSIKHLHRLIVTSSTYRQTSTASRELYQTDPANRLLARGPRIRVDAEVVRDIALATSGLLKRTVGGRGIYPPAPDFLFRPPTSYGPKVWNVEPNDEQYRRSLYIFRFRSVPFPMLQTFDAPNGDVSCVRRARSNTPLQALITLNEPQFMDCARALARRTITSASNDVDRLRHAFRTVTARIPTDDELADLLDLLHDEKAHIAGGWVNPIQLATGTDDVPRGLPDGTNVTDLAAHTVIARVLLNLDETVTKE